MASKILRGYTERYLSNGPSVAVLEQLRCWLWTIKKLGVKSLARQPLEFGLLQYVLEKLLRASGAKFTRMWCATRRDVNSYVHSLHIGLGGHKVQLFKNVPSKEMRYIDMQDIRDTVQTDMYYHGGNGCAAAAIDYLMLAFDLTEYICFGRAFRLQRPFD